MIVEAHWWMGLEYFLSGKKGLVVISLRGELDDTSWPVLKKCLDEVFVNSPGGAILHMADTHVQKKGFRDFSVALRSLKARCKAVKVTALNPETKSMLMQDGLLGISDARETLMDALKEVALLIRTGS